MKNDFIFQIGDTNWLHFHRPKVVIQTNRPEEIISALSRIDQAVQGEGLYAAGFLTYEAAPAFDSAFISHPPGELPLLWFGLYEAPSIFDQVPLEELGTTLDLGPIDPDCFSVSVWTPSTTRDDYPHAFNRIKVHIARGDTYQVNLTHRLRANFTGSEWAFFHHLSQAQKYGYAAYIDTGRYVVASASPELFFRLDGDRLTAKPMKGTLPRNGDAHEDEAQAARLLDSEKDRAENLMIVDMVRNDMGRIAQTGSVTVPQLFEIERYPTVFQMTSTVECRATVDFPEIMGALYPCASITGAPKVRTMEIIRSLEPDPRGLYTGCIGYFGPGRQALFSVAIRTATIDRAQAQVEYGVGGGIVWDSVCSKEYQECNDKAQILPGIR